jgi:hypothetical protein
MLILYVIALIACFVNCYLAYSTPAPDDQVAKLKRSAILGWGIAAIMFLGEIFRVMGEQVAG